MGRAKLPEARIEPRGVEGHLAKLKADARQHARVAGAVSIHVARIVGWTAFAATTVAVLVWLAPPPSNPRLDDIKRLQADFQRSQERMEQARRTMEQFQQMNQVRLMEDLRSVQPLPAYDVKLYTSPAYDLSRLRVSTPLDLPAWQRDTNAPTHAAKADRAAERVRAVEQKRAERTSNR